MSALPAPQIAYFSMEIALDPSISTYSGGLGVLAGDTLRSAADHGVSMVAITLVQRQGYFHQILDADGNQTEAPAPWDLAATLEPVDVRLQVRIEGRDVALQVWRYDVTGESGARVTVYLLDADVAGNDPHDRSLTDRLYGGDERYRLSQEAILGIGGVHLLRTLYESPIAVFHMNEGHSALLVVALLQERLRNAGRHLADPSDVAAVAQKCVFTTHTPVPAGHDRFSPDSVRSILGDERYDLIERAGGFHEGVLNMTYLALNGSRYVNGVALRHEQVSQAMFPGHEIHGITNGVHPGTWTSPAFAALFDRHMPEWRRDRLFLRYAIGISLDEIAEAHTQAKRALLAEVARRGTELDPNVLTLGFARRATAYKRGDLMFRDIERLRSIARNAGRFQIVFGGKAHPHDFGGKDIIRRVFAAARALGPDVPVVYIENYEWPAAQLMTAGVDVWVNTPNPPLEASGTSGMKAALNGVPSLSVLDGWWIEGHLEGVTGWAIEGAPNDDDAAVHSFYDRLEHAVIPAYYGDRTAFAAIMRNTIAYNASFFNTQRMLSQYVANAYFPPVHNEPVSFAHLSDTNAALFIPTPPSPVASM